MSCGSFQLGLSCENRDEVGEGGGLIGGSGSGRGAEEEGVVQEEVFTPHKYRIPTNRLCIVQNW